jgi:glycosyltransferase involved in cell wall biosynthesis
MIYFRPAFGGIFDYSESVLRIMREHLPGNPIDVVTVRSEGTPFAQGVRLAREFWGRDDTLYVDMGAGDGGLFWALHFLSFKLDTVVTLHDPGVVVGAVVRAPATGLRVAQTLAEKLYFRLNRWAAPHLIRATLTRCRAVLVLNSAVQEVFGVRPTYLPQPVYRPTPIVRQTPPVPTIAYLGYWGDIKGLGEIIEAFGLLIPRFPGVRFVIGGGAPPGNPAYDQAWRARIAAVSPRIEVPGFIPPSDLDRFIEGLSALVLPYHPELAGGASAMLMRAQEAGVPLVLTDTTMLRAQVDPRNVTLVPARNGPALAGAIARVLTHPQYVQKAAAREQARIYAQHGHRMVAERLLRILGPGVLRSQ